ncbi:hypothetical protein BG000_002769 [Podila horticola]|nr:hypothetical protein BG000_002769 [Podila horticola]
MTDNRMTLFCLVDGEATSTAFSITIPLNDTVGDLKNLIKTRKANDFSDIDANHLTLWRVSISDDNQGVPITIVSLEKKTELNNPRTRLSKLFLTSPDDNTYIIVQRPPPGSSSKRMRLDKDTLMVAIEAAGLTEKAAVKGQYDLTRLDNKERVSLLGFMGHSIVMSDSFMSLSSTALGLHDADIKGMDKLSAPRGRVLPVVETNDLYIRQSYKDLYDKILGKFENKRPYDPECKKHVVVTGTSGIGKSAFLVYFAIRLLAEGDDNNPSMIIFHTKRKDECYVFGGRSFIRSGNIEDFRPFLTVPDTWYLVDSSPEPVLDRAKTIISASPRTLASERHQYQDVDKRVTFRYYMAPWNLKELDICRNSVACFQEVPPEMMRELYSEIGGVPRYVLEIPMRELKLNPNGLDLAKASARYYLEQALNNIMDPITMMQYFVQGKKTLEFSGRLIHRWPSDDEHRQFRLEWASANIARRVSELLTEEACTKILKQLIIDPEGSASGIMFEAYVLRTFRTGGHTFDFKDLETGHFKLL